MGDFLNELVPPRSLDELSEEMKKLVNDFRSLAVELEQASKLDPERGHHFSVLVMTADDKSTEGVSSGCPCSIVRASTHMMSKNPLIFQCMNLSIQRILFGVNSKGDGKSSD